MSISPPRSSQSLLLELAREGALRAGVPLDHGGAGGNLADAMDAVAATARHDVFKGLVLASQRLLMEAVLQARNVALREHHLPALLAGDIGGSCAASWPLDADVMPLAAIDTGRGWRVSGRLPVMPNLDADWFLMSVPVSFDDRRSYSLVMLRSDEDGLRVGASGLEGAELELRNVFLREDEILSTDGPSAIARLALVSGALQAAVWSGSTCTNSRSCGVDAEDYFSELRASAASGTLTTAHLSAVRAKDICPHGRRRGVMSLTC